MATATVREQLRQTNFLAGVTESALHQLSQLVTPVEYEAGDLLFDEGSPRTFMVILVAGAVAIEKTAGGRCERLVTLGPGEAVGEGLLLDDSPHGTSARALQRVSGFRLGAEQVPAMLREYPQLYAALITRAARAISQRLRATDATLVGRGRMVGFTGARTRTEK